jgi:hypothetical protein
VSQAWDRQRKARQARRAERAARAVPASGTEEKPDKKNQGGARAREGFAKPGLSYGEIPNERAKWEPRVRSWREFRFWLPLWGPKPDEMGCFAPREVLQAVG